MKVGTKMSIAATAMNRRSLISSGGTPAQPSRGIAAICQEPEGSVTSAVTGIVGEHARGPEEAGPGVARRRPWPTSADVDRQVGVQQAAVGEQAMDVDHRRDDAPEAPAARWRRERTPGTGR